jgi:hypothetical protein
MRRVESEKAERSRAELMFAWAAHNAWRTRHSTKPTGRLHSRTASGRVEHLTLPYFAAVAEEFSRAVLVECSAPLVPDHPMLQALWVSAEGQAETWPGQEKAWQDWHGIALKSEMVYRQLRTVVQARNAIVHGLGELTRRQLGSDGGRKVRKELATVGIRTSGRRLIIDDAAMKRSLAAARAFIFWLDQETQARGLRS